VIGLHRTVEKRIDPRFFKAAKKGKKSRRPFFEIPLETKGKVLNRKSFKGIKGLKQALLTHQDRLTEGYIQALLTFANGRKAGAVDKSIVDSITQRAAKVEYPARSIIKAVVYSKAFTAN